jgi:hypothetical protein
MIKKANYSTVNHNFNIYTTSNELFSLSLSRPRSKRKESEQQAGWPIYSQRRRNADIKDVDDNIVGKNVTTLPTYKEGEEDARTPEAERQ